MSAPMTAAEIVEALCRAVVASVRASAHERKYYDPDRDAIKAAMVEWMTANMPAYQCETDYCDECVKWRKLEDACRGK